jgi:hypothetical protein
VKKSLLAITVLFVASGAVFAEDPDPSGQFALQATSTRSRAEVRAEAVSAVAAGKLRPSNPHASAYVQPPMQTATTREQVVSDFMAHRSEAAALTAEDSGSAYLAKAGHAMRVDDYSAKAK